MRVLNPIIVGLLISFVMMPACFATVISEESAESTAAAIRKVQIIEGDQVIQAPLPYSYVAVETPDSPNTGQTKRPWTYLDIRMFVMKTNPALSPREVTDIAYTIGFLSNRYGLNPRLFASLVCVESSFRPAAISSSGAIGLGQLKPDTAQWLGVSNPFDPAQNLAGVAKYLRYLLDRYDGSVHHALAAYFQGQGTIDQRGIDDGAVQYIGRVSKAFNRTF